MYNRQRGARVAVWEEDGVRLSLGFLPQLESCKDRRKWRASSRKKRGRRSIVFFVEMRKCRLLALGCLLAFFGQGAKGWGAGRPLVTRSSARESVEGSVTRGHSLLVTTSHTILRVVYVHTCYSEEAS